MKFRSRNQAGGGVTPVFSQWDHTADTLANNVLKYHIRGNTCPTSSGRGEENGKKVVLVLGFAEMLPELFESALI